MAKGVVKDSLANSGTASNMSSGLASNAGALYGSLAPTLSAEAAHPSGYTPTQKAAMDTAAQQSAGGSMAGATGQGALLAARTKNAGAAQNAIQQSGRQASQNVSDAAVGTEVANANLQQKQQQAGITGEENLYNTELGGSQNALGLSNSALNTANSADANNPYMQLLQSGIAAGGQVGAAALKPCWIAAELYGGWTDPRTILVRHWVTTELPKRTLGRWIVAAYCRWGERSAAHIRTHRLARTVMQYLFGCVLARAQRSTL
jgi:hypothetical protein